MFFIDDLFNWLLALKNKKSINYWKLNSSLLSYCSRNVCVLCSHLLCQCLLRLGQKSARCIRNHLANSINCIMESHPYYIGHFFKDLSFSNFSMFMSFFHETMVTIMIMIIYVHPKSIINNHSYSSKKNHSSSSWSSSRRHRCCHNEK